MSAGGHLPDPRLARIASKDRCASEDHSSLCSESKTHISHMLRWFINEKQACTHSIVLSRARCRRPRQSCDLRCSPSVKILDNNNCQALQRSSCVQRLQQLFSQPPLTAIFHDLCAATLPSTLPVAAPSLSDMPVSGKPSGIVVNAGLPQLPVAATTALARVPFSQQISHDDLAAGSSPQPAPVAAFAVALATDALVAATMLAGDIS